MIQTKLETITPKTATQYLLTNKHNRKVRDAHVEYLKNEILAGRWLATHQGIAFDESGELIDGQHRLRACIAAATPIKIFVARGVPKHVNGDVNLFTMDVIDNGATRTTADQLALMHGIKNANLTSATCRILARIFDSKAKLSVGAANRILVHYGASIEKLIDAVSGGGHARIGRRAPVIAAYALGYHVNADITMEFAKQVATGEDIRRGDPSFALRDWLLSGVSNSGLATGRQILSRACGALAAALKGESLKIVKVNDAALDWLVAKQRSKMEMVRAAIAGPAKP